MIPLLIFSLWILVLVLVGALCVSARRGDRDEVARATTPASVLGQARLAEWESAKHLAVYAHAARASAAARPSSARPAEGARLAGVDRVAA